MPSGAGAVDAAARLEKLLNGGYCGPLTIEREIAGEAQTRDILAAKNGIEAVLTQRANGELMINVGLIGIGAMGRMHFNCYKNNPDARLHAICDGDAARLRGD